jgi:hypothetical protein
MKIRFFDKETGKDMPSQTNYLVDNLGQVFENCFNQWDNEENLEDRPGIGWEFIDDQIKYVILDDRGFYSLSDKVKNFIQLGYSLHGQPIRFLADDGAYYFGQAMKKETK